MDTKEKDCVRNEKQKKARKRKYHEANREISTAQKQTEQDTIITKHRITRSLGIYSKAKMSDKVFREKDEQKVAKKKCKGVDEQTKKDLSRILDVSSFGIKPFLGEGTVSSTNRNLLSIFLDTYTPTERSSMSSPNETVTSSLCGSAGSFKQSHTPYGKRGLPFKAPLQEISERLTESLQPTRVFNGRDYFSEVKEELLKVYKQSSANKVNGSKHESALHQRLVKRKGGETTKNTPKEVPSIQYHSSNNSTLTKAKLTGNQTETQPHKKELYEPREVHEQSLKQYEPLSNTLNLSPSDLRLLKKFDVPTHEMIDQRENERRENCLFKHLELLQPHKGERNQEISNDNSCGKLNTSFDILDFLDHTEKTTNQNTKCFYHQKDGDIDLLEKAFPEVLPFKNSWKKTSISPTFQKRPFFPHQKDDDIEFLERTYPEVSPLKKPSLKTPSPPKFYRRKMY